jgi:hypothetical protein
MNREFSFYEFVGIIAPGTILIIILTQVFPDVLKVIDIEGLSIGEFGVFVIIAYTVGHLIQSLGNLLEKIWWWFFGGMPTNWIIQDKKSKYLSEEQLKSFPNKIANVLKLEAKTSLREYKPEQWIAITRQIYAAVKQNNAAERVDVFNGNYGFFRGIASAVVVGLVMLLIKSGITQWELLVMITAFLIMAIARMHRFARHYAVELFVQFLQVKDKEE